MLRIAIHDNPGSLRFHLEGRLAGPWVRELEAGCSLWYALLRAALAVAWGVELTSQATAQGRVVTPFPFLLFLLPPLAFSG